jgi:hypothetical protein
VSVIESIVKELQGLPESKPVEVAHYIHGLTEAGQQERLAILRTTFGALSEEDGEAFEAAMMSSRRVAPK